MQTQNSQTRQLQNRLQVMNEIDHQEVTGLVGDTEILSAVDVMVRSL